MTRRHPTDAELLALVRRTDPSLPKPPAFEPLLARFKAIRRFETTYRRYELTGVLHWERVNRRLTARLARSA